jgi:hypothetical protein
MNIKILVRKTMSGTTFLENKKLRGEENCKGFIKITL